MKINSIQKIAEIVGIILGDGHLHTKENRVTIVGSLEDYHYYVLRVIPLFRKEFGLIPVLRRRKDRNAYYLQIQDKRFFQLLTRELGLRRGHKKNARIPDIITNKELIPYFLRGLFDTDGCLKFSKQSRKVNYYPRIQLAFQKSKFAEEIGPLLSKIGFSFGKWNENLRNLTYYQISGKSNLEKWFSTINPQNQVHTTKYNYWKNYDFYVPKSTMVQRLKALDLNTYSLNLE